LTHNLDPQANGNQQKAWTRADSTLLVSLKQSSLMDSGGQPQGNLNLRVEGSIPSRLTISRVNAINDLRRSQPRPQMGIEPIDPQPSSPPPVRRVDET